MGMSRIELPNTAALPMVPSGETPLPAPPRTPSLQGSGTDKENVIPEKIAPGEAEQRAKFQKEIVEELINDQKEILEKLEPPITSTRLKVDEENRRIVIQILDAKKNEIIRQIPPEEWLKFLSRWQKIQGLFFNETI